MSNSPSDAKTKGEEGGEKTEEVRKLIRKFRNERGRWPNGKGLAEFMLEEYKDRPAEEQKKNPSTPLIYAVLRRERLKFPEDSERCADVKVDGTNLPAPGARTAAESDFLQYFFKSTVELSRAIELLQSLHAFVSGSSERDATKRAR